MDLNIVSKDGTIVTMPYIQNENTVKNKITVTEHPHPFTIVVIILIICYLGYIFYTVKMKTDLNGVWYIGTEKITVTHDKYGCCIRFKYDTDAIEYTGNVKGEVIYMDKVSDGMHTDIGIYHDKKIHWIKQDSIWTRTKTS